MELAALILSVMALLMSSASIIWLLAKQLSTHQIQMVPAESLVPAPQNITADPIGDLYRDFDRPHIMKNEPLDKDEQAYFEKFQ